MPSPTVSVVIPTVDRPAVRAAVISAVNQTLRPLEVIVAVDRADEYLPPALADLRDQIRPVWTGGIGPSGARMRAASEARGELIAFLDDDDVWFQTKLERQLAAWPTSAARRFTLMGSRFILCSPSGESCGTCPSRLFVPGQRMPAYLFRRTQIRYRETALHPSTMICDRGLLHEEPWDDRVRLHEDWDWLLRVASRGDTEIMMMPDALTKVSIGNPRSLSHAADWWQSRAWLQARADQLSKREIGDFLLCYPAVLAFRAGNYRGAFGTAGYALAKGRPGPYSCLVWLLNLVSPALVNAASRVLNKTAREDLADAELAESR